MSERLDWTRFATFMCSHLRDPTFEPAFRQGYASERTRDEVAYREKRAVVHSIWRVNGRNQRALEELVSRLDSSGIPAAALVRAMRSASLVRIHLSGSSGTCSLGNGVVPWPRRVECLDATGSISYEALVTSDVCLWLQCVNVLAHFVEYTSAQLATIGGAPSEAWLDAQWGVWKECLALVERWASAE